MRKNLKAVALATGVVVLGGGGVATAQSLITGAGVKNSSLTGADVKNNSLTGKDIKDIRSGDVRDGSIQLKDLSPQVRQALASAGTAGAGGAPGLNGAPGATGATGAAGANGAAGSNGAAGTNGTNGTNGENGENADGSKTVRVRQSGDAGFTIDKVAGSGGNAGTASVEGDNLLLKIAAPGGGFAGAYRVGDLPMSQLSALSYKFDTIERTNGTKVAPTLKLDVVGAADGSGEAGAEARPPFSGGATTLVYEPTYTQDAIRGGTLDALDTTKPSRWWSTRAIKTANNRSTFVSLASIIQANPGMTIKRIYVEAGENSQSTTWSPFTGTVDWLRINGSRYDFGSPQG